MTQIDEATESTERETAPSRSSRYVNPAGVLAGLAIGAGAMYLLDPDRGNRRRTLIRDKAALGVRKTKTAVDKSVRDLGNRARGAAAEAWSVVKRRDASDEVLVERIRSRIGRVVSHPGAIEVTAHGGRVELAGPILESEADDLIDAVCSVRGVRDVEDRLDKHSESEAVPGLQNGDGRTGPRPDFLQDNWAPATRLMVGTGAALVLALAPRNRYLGVPLRVAGALLLARAATNLPLSRLSGVAGGGRAVRFQKTITLDAPIERVFDLWRNPENFPRFMAHVREVERIGDDRFRWTVVGPAGISASWNSRITELEPDRLIAWKSEPGSLIRTAGVVRFEREGTGTRVHVLMSYNPPAGAIGHAVAVLFRSNPKTAMDEDLARLKSLLEEGATTAHSERVTLQEVSS